MAKRRQNNACALLAIVPPEQAIEIKSRNTRKELEEFNSAIGDKSDCDSLRRHSAAGSCRHTGGTFEHHIGFDVHA